MTQFKKCADFYEWLDKKGHYDYAARYELEVNTSKLLCQLGYDAFCAWLNEQGHGDLVYQYERTKH